MISNMQRLFFSTGSRYKIEQLRRLGVPFSSAALEVREERLPGESANILAARLASDKSIAGMRHMVRDLASDPPRDDILGDLLCGSLGADQVITYTPLHSTPQILNKPITRQRAIDQLMLLQGKTHLLLCAITLTVVRFRRLGHELVPLDTAIFRDTTTIRMHMRSLSIAEAAAYVDRDTPLDCAGSYRIESYGISLFDRLRGDDYTAIIGLPLTRVHHLLRDAGFETSPQEPV